MGDNLGDDGELENMPHGGLVDDSASLWWLTSFDSSTDLIN